MPRTSTARERLIASASQLIHAGSYASASVDDLCLEAGVQRGSFYYFFPSKRDLALAAVDEHWAQTQRTILGPAFAPDVEPLARIARFFRVAAGQQEGAVVRGCPFGNLAVEMSTLDEVIRERVAAVFDGYRAYFERALREAAADGALPAAAVPSVAQALVAYLQGMLLLAKAHNDAGVAEQLAGQALDLIPTARPMVVGSQPSTEELRS